MREERPRVSIVVAVYDDEPTVEELVRRVRTTMEGCRQSFEIIFVDDGSHDCTASVLRRLEEQDSRLRVFEFTRNFGQAAALACGLFAARGEVVVTLDGDLQNPPEEIPKLVAAINDRTGAASARRGRRHESLGRWLGSRAVHWLACRVTGIELDDFGGNFKAYRHDVVAATRAIWAPGKPFFPLALWLGYGVAEVTVQHEPRRFGSSRYTLLALLRINADLILSFTTFPLPLLGLTGLVSLALGLAGLGVVQWSQPASWLPAAIALTLIICGSVFTTGGVLGAYLGRVYRLVAGGEPAYVVRRAPADCLESERNEREPSPSR